MKIDRMRVFMTRDKDRPRVIVALDTDDGLTGWGAVGVVPVRRSASRAVMVAASSSSWAWVAVSWSWRSTWW